MEAAINTTRRGFFGHAAGAYMAAGALATGALVADPVFSVIEEHLALWLRVEALADETDMAFDRFGAKSAEAERCEKAQCDASTRETAYLTGVLVATVPTTLPGLTAYVDYLAGSQGFGATTIDRSQDAVFATIAASLRLIASNH